MTRTYLITLVVARIVIGFCTHTYIITTGTQAQIITMLVRARDEYGITL